MAKIGLGVDVYGVQAALKEIYDVDRKVRRQVTLDLTRIGIPLLVAARKLIPDKPPLSGMGKGSLIKGRDGTKWSSAAAAAGFQIKTAQRGQRAREVTYKSGTTVNYGATSFALMVLQQKNQAAAIWDHAGIKGLDSLFVGNLNKDGEVIGRAPRAAEPGAQEAYPAIEAELLAVVEGVMKKVNRNIAVTRGN